LRVGLRGFSLRPSATKTQSHGGDPLLSFALLQGLPGLNRLLRGFLSWGFPPLQRSQPRGATYAGVASPDCAAPPGFLSLLTPSSPRSLPALFHAGGTHGVSPFRGFPPQMTVLSLDKSFPSWRSGRFVAQGDNPKPASVLSLAQLASLRLAEVRPCQKTTTQARLQGFEHI